MKVKAKSRTYDAVQWKKHGDHPDVLHLTLELYEKGNYEGTCNCEDSFSIHGLIETIDGLYLVCPGDWTVTGPYGQYVFKPHEFEQIYEEV